MAKRLLPVRLNERTRAALDRFVRLWNKSGAPQSNRTLIVETAINDYLKRWRPVIGRIRDFQGRAKSKRARVQDVVEFRPRSRAQFR